MKLQCIHVAQERRFDFDKKADVTLSETYTFVPAAEVTVTEPQKESPGGNAQPVDPKGGKRQLVSHTARVTMTTTDPSLFGAYSEGGVYELTISAAKA